MRKGRIEIWSGISTGPVGSEPPFVLVISDSLSSGRKAKPARRISLESRRDRVDATYAGVGRVSIVAWPSMEPGNRSPKVTRDRVKVEGCTARATTLGRLARGPSIAFDHAPVPRRFSRRAGCDLWQDEARAAIATWRDRARLTQRQRAQQAEGETGRARGGQARREAAHRLNGRKPVGGPCSDSAFGIHISYIVIPVGARNPTVTAPPAIDIPLKFSTSSARL